MDGSDVVEAISLAVNLDKHKYIAVDYFAIDQEMTHHWDHQNWTSMNRVRNAKHEAARLLRTAHIYDLDYLKEEIKSYDGLFIPGGRGVAWNL
ncbi:unnamed protein product [Trichogramma brassicae]|uniref:DJ-1/PfpI domain-containing protein n=1 Tax=Trichogramma brassicae TaxID=86971 RepID=A0A6H5J4G8_9HYME|nr:unnamed protein product [Trichogramma brassicae]